MIISIKKDLAERIGLKKLEPFGFDKTGWTWHTTSRGIALANLDAGKLDALECLLATQADQPGVKAMLRDFDTWKKAIRDASKLKARTLRAFETILQQYLLKVPGHRIYAKLDDEDAADQWLAYYVEGIKYHPAEDRRGDYVPARVIMSIFWTRFGGRRSTTVTFREDDVRGRNVVEILAHKGYYPENTDLRTQYLASVERFTLLAPMIGKQFLATGSGTDTDVDGNRRERRDNSWWYSRRHDYDLDQDGEPSRVVIDLFYEDGQGREKDGYVSESFWPRVAGGRKTSLEDDEDPDDADDLDEDDLGRDIPEIPVHPYLVVFHLRKHLRLRVHVGQLTAYDYDRNLVDKLVLSEDRKALVRMLIEHKSGAFQDIVHGKGGGAVVLLAGPPGTGKTLTAEVYAESEARALYSIQCSQLGTDPDTLEDELLKVFARAKRWDAVMLLDEADVYVHERGNDMGQNAIVGVFLRVLEYQDSVLFLTTNRPDDVDDAIASRCIARLTYTIPTAAEQTTIWKVLAESSGVPAKQLDVDGIVATHPGLSGRDVKNLLKLAKLINPERIDAGTITFVAQFKPTKGTAAATVVAMPAGIGRCPACGVMVGKKGHLCPKAVK